MSDKKYILGIDIGTTSVKVCVVNDGKEVVAKHTKETEAKIQSEEGVDGDEQDVEAIISALDYCVSQLSKDMLRQVTKIGVCGQMHGVVLWRNG
jgi:sedoheptulokinase